MLFTLVHCRQLAGDHVAALSGATTTIDLMMRTGLDLLATIGYPVCDIDVPFLVQCAGEVLAANQMFQPARMMAENLLHWAEEQPLADQREAWIVFANINQRCHSTLMATYALACAKRLPVARLSRQRHAHEVDVEIRLLRDLGENSLALARIDAAQQSSAFADIGESLQQLEERRMSIYMHRLRLNQDGPIGEEHVGLLTRLIRFYAGQVRDHLDRERSVFTYVLNLGYLVGLYRYRTGHEPPAARALLDRALATLHDTVASYVRSMVAASPDLDDLRTTARHSLTDRYSNDLSASMHHLRLTAKRMLGNPALADPSHALVALGGHTKVIGRFCCQRTLIGRLTLSQELGCGGSGRRGLCRTAAALVRSG